MAIQVEINGKSTELSEGTTVAAFLASKNLKPVALAVESLGTMVRYWIGTGGKRLRAVLPLAAYEAVGRDPVEIVSFVGGG